MSVGVKDISPQLPQEGLQDTRGQLERESRRLVRTGLLVLLAACVPAGLWLATADLASAVVTMGYLKVERDRTPVQHVEGGTVRDVLVRDGQRVRAGDPLIVLGDVAVDANMLRWDARVRAERASVARLEAEQSMAPTLSMPMDLVAAAAEDTGLAELLEREQQLFDTRRRSLLTQSGLLQTQRSRIQQEISALQAQISQAQEALRLQGSELGTNRKLQQEGFISATRVNQIEAQLADYGVKLEERRSELARAEQRLVDVDLRAQGLEADYRQQANDQLKMTLARLAEVQQEQRKTTDAAQRQVIKAPASGEIMGLRVTAPGAVIGAQDVLAEIVPDEQPLVVEARLRPEDIESVQPGQQARMRFTAFSHRATPMVEGTVSYLAPDRMVDRETGEPYFVAQIRLSAEALRNVGAMALRTGMSAEVYIEGPARTPIEYLMEPLTQVAQRAARER